jgi:hypothetical protein
MAAPSTAYLNKNINTISSTGQQVANSRAIPTDDATTLKLRFHLDSLLITKDADGNEGFTGLVDVSGVNYKMHNTGRIGSLRAFNNGESQVNYTDAGLNTLATAGIIDIFNRATNYFKVHTQFKSSFYDNSTQRGYQYRVNGGAWESYTTSSTIIPANTSIDPLEIVTTAYETMPANIELRPWVTNPEGTFIGEAISFEGQLPIYSYATEKRGNPCDVGSGVPTNLWMRKDTYQRIDGSEVTTSEGLTGLRAYQDSEFGQPADAGYYALLSPTDSNKIFQVDTTGQFTSYVICIPDTPDPSILTIGIYKYFNGNEYYATAQLTGSIQTFDIHITGHLGAFANGSGELLSQGDGSFSLTIPAGQGYAEQITTFQPLDFGGSDWDYLQPVVESIDPSTIQYSLQRIDKN